MSDAAETTETQETPEETPPVPADAANDTAAATPPEAKDAKEPKGKDAKAPPEPTVADVNRLERAKAAAAKMSANRRAQEQSAREAQATRYALQQREAELAAERKEKEALKARMDRVENDPLAYLRDERRLTADELAKRAVEDADPATKLKRLEDRLAASEERWNESQRAKDEERRKAASDAQMEQAKKAFLEKAGDAEAYPTIAAHAKVRPNAIVREVLEIIEDAHKRTGHVYSDEEVLEYLEAVYAEAAGKPNGNGATSKQSNGGLATQSRTSAQETALAGKPRTLSGKDAGQTTSVPQNFDDLSDAEQKKWMAARYKSLAK